MSQKDRRTHLLSLAQELECISSQSDDDVSDLIDSARQKVLEACAQLHEQERDIDAEIKDANLD